MRLADGDDVGIWQVARRSGELAAEMLADRPVEERARGAWTVDLGGAPMDATADRAR